MPDNVMGRDMQRTKVLLTDKLLVALIGFETYGPLRQREGQAAVSRAAWLREADGVTGCHAEGTGGPYEPPASGDPPCPAPP